MSVTVVIARDEHGAPSTREVYATADRYVINDGNLDVAVQGIGTLGTYGSGNWLSVYTDDVVEVITVKPAEDDDSSDFSMDFGDDSSDDSSDDSTDDSTDDSSDESTEGSSDEDS